MLYLSAGGERRNARRRGILDSINRLLYAFVLALIGLALITFRDRIAELRNRHTDPEHDRWGEAKPGRYLLFGLVFLALAIASLVLAPW